MAAARASDKEPWLDSPRVSDVDLFRDIGGLAERLDLEYFHSCSLHGRAGLLTPGWKRSASAPWILVY